MELLKDLYYVNRMTVKKTSKLFIPNWPIALTGFIYIFLNALLVFIIATIFRGAILGIFTGILLTISTSAMISNYLYLLHNILRYGKFTLQDFKNGFKIYLWKIYGILVIGWLASLLLNRIVAPVLHRFFPTGILSLIINIVILIFLNPLPESIYQKFYSSWETITYAFDFIKENWIEWFVPNIILLAALYFITGRIIFNLFSIHIGMNIDFSIYSIFQFLIGQLLFSFTMIYRGVLFDILSTSTRRKRMFMRDLYN